MIRDIVSASQWTATDICMEDYPVFYIPKKNPTFPQISALGSPNFTQRPLSTCAWSPEGFGEGWSHAHQGSMWGARPSLMQD